MFISNPNQKYSVDEASKKNASLIVSARNYLNVFQFREGLHTSSLLHSIKIRRYSEYSKLINNF